MTCFWQRFVTLLRRLSSQLFCKEFVLSAHTHAFVCAQVSLLKRLRHPNIISFLGVYKDPTPGETLHGDLVEVVVSVEYLHQFELKISELNSSPPRTRTGVPANVACAETGDRR